MEQQSENRRKHLRFRCGGEVDIRSLSSGAGARGAIANLSLSGCLVELADGRSFRRREAVEMTFCVRHLPVRVQASVRQVYPDHQVGVEFTRLSERGRRQLRDLIEELAEMSRNQVGFLAGAQE
ncbi:MAG: PilZ domain-containing protein [Acidobacteriaceae bacterium]